MIGSECVLGSERVIGSECVFGSEYVIGSKRESHLSSSFPERSDQVVVRSDVGSCGCVCVGLVPVEVPVKPCEGNMKTDLQQQTILPALLTSH